jgi:hypothetical protein
VLKKKAVEFDSDEEFKSLPEFTLLDKYNYLKKKVWVLVSEKEHTETDLAKAKIRWADLELQYDNLQLRLHQAGQRYTAVIMQKASLESQLMQTK